MIESLINILESWELDIKALLAKLIIGLAVLLIFYGLGKITKKIAYKINSKVLSKYPDLQSLLSSLIYYFFVFIGCFLFLKIIGLEQYFVKLLAGAGIIGIIAGFALKDIASNAFSGLLLFIEKPFKKGDWVQVDGHYGKAVNLGLLTTAIANGAGQQVYISNQLIYSGVFINYSIFKKRSIRIQADVIQYPDLPGLKKMVLAEILKIKEILPTSEVHFYVKLIGTANNFSFELYFWVYFDDQRKYMKILDQTILTIRQIAIDSKIEIINVKWVSDETDVSSAGTYGLG